MKMPTYEELSREQDALYLTAPLDGAVLVTGPPGTGKTVMAFYRAQMVLKQKRPVCVVMYNSVLKRYTKGALPDPDVAASVKTWHSWFYSWWRQILKCNVPEEERWSPDWSRVMERLITQPATCVWDHVVLDEGQDFPAKFYNAANVIVKICGNGKNAITIFADENQRICKKRNSTISEIRQALYIDGSREFKLTRNYRNTVQIAMLAEKFYVGLQSGVPAPPSRKGQKPTLVRHDAIKNAMKSIIRFARNNADLSIGVFVRNKHVQKQVANMLYHENGDDGNILIQRYTSGERGDWGDADSLNFKDNGSITVLNIQSCKGLEFDAVFIPEIQDYSFAPADIDHFKMQMYVMATRAREYLCLMYTGSAGTRFPLHELLPGKDEGILEHRDGN